MMAQTRTHIRFERFAWKPAPGAAARLAAALVVSFLLFGPYLANVFRDYTRVCYFWQFGDTLGLIFLVLLVAGVFWIAGAAVRWTRWSLLIRFSKAVFVFLFGYALVANVAFILPKLHFVSWTPSPQLQRIALAMVLLLAVVAFIRKTSMLEKYCRSVCLVVSPAVPLTFLTLLLQQNYPQRTDSIPISGRPCALTAQPPRAAHGGVYVFLFDEWSYERTFRDGQVLTRYPNLAAFALNSTVYSDARSPAGNTESSLPGILFQTSEPVVVDRGRFGFARQSTFVPARECQSIFSRMPLRFYTAMIGCALPYGSWLGNSVEVCRSRCYYERGEDAVSRLSLHLLNTLHYSPDPWTQRWYKRMEAESTHRVICGILENTRKDVSKIIREWPTDTFLFAHVHLPHMPAVLNPDLSFRDVQTTAWGDADLSGYEANLQAMDVMIGEFVAGLRAAGKYDNSVIVLTSDHSWRKDPERTSGRSSAPVTHVPLLVKAPGQARAVYISSLYETKNLGALIESLVCGNSEAVIQLTENRQ